MYKSCTEQFNISENEFNLYANGHVIDEHTLAQLMGEHLDLCVDVEGGKKRKKKVYKTPKRKPHKHKLEKLCVLKHYKIEGQTVKRQREFCEKTGYTFMAQHKDGRKHCGLTGFGIAPEKKAETKKAEGKKK